MNTNQSSAELKASAKEHLFGKYGTVIGAVLLVQLIVAAINLAVNSIVDVRSVIGLILFYIIQFVLSLFQGILVSGQAYLFMKVVYGHPVKVTDIFAGFSQNAEKAVLIQLCISVVTYVCTLPSVILGEILLHRSSSQSNVYLLLAACILLTVGGIILTIVSLALSMSFYLLHDFPQYSSKELLSMSRRLMKGHKGRLFYLEVSFLPLMLLSLLSCGIALLWLIPYMNAATAAFYQDLMSHRNDPPQY